MKKKIIIIITILVIILLGILGYIYIHNQLNTDAIKFKKEYESLNSTNTAINISKDNPFIYKEASDIIDMINNKETFIVYFGYNSDELTRSILPVLIKAASDLKIDQIYYVDIKDIRNEITINEDNTYETTKTGTDSYNKLLEILNDYLSDYELTNSKGKIIKVGKRIYTPSVISVVDGIPKGLTTGATDNKTDIEITDEIITNAYKEFIKVLSLINITTCDSAC